MSYFGSGIGDSDFAAGRIGVAVLRLKDQLFEDAQLVMEERHPEQAILFHLSLIRSICREHGKFTIVHFNRRDLARVKRAFSDWYLTVESDIPKRYREDLLATADREFELFEEEVFPASSN